MPSPTKLFVSLGLSAVLAASGRAQLELPAESVKPRPAGESVDLGTPPRGDVAERASGRRLYDRPKAGTGELTLPGARPAAPSAPGAAPATGSADAAPGPAPAPGAAAPAAPAPISIPPMARFVLDGVAALRDAHNPMVEHGAQTLARLGEEGRAAALSALASEHPPSLLLGAKALLNFGDEPGCDAVIERLRLRLPSSVCAPLVDLLVARDPVRAGPSLLGELLAHRQGQVRVAAQRHLAALGTELPAAALLPALRSKESDARLRAVGLLSASSDPAALGLLFERLTDSSSSVGRRAVEVLALRPEERLAPDLLRRAFDAQWLLREQALALVALCEREDLRFEAYLTDVHRARLVDGMASNDPFVSGACAAALAGVGYRGAPADDSRWYDLDVPHRLVRVVAAQDFARDLSTLAPTAMRRLALVTGVDFGADGPRWIEWWSANATSFRAARARLEAGPDSALELALVVRSNVSGGESFTLLGPGWAREGRAPRAVLGEKLILTPTQASGALLELTRLGLLGVEALPGVRGSASAPGRALVLELDGRQKSFRFSDAPSTEWFDSALVLARSLRERNRWQLLHDPRAGLAFEDWWRREASWWEETSDEALLARRLWELSLDRAASAPLTQRDNAISRLAVSARDAGPLSRDDGQRLMALVASEPHVSTRLDVLLELALGALSVEGALAPDDARAVLTTLLERFGPEASSQIARVLHKAPPEFAHEASADAQSLLRAIAASVLAQRGAPEDIARLLALLDDPSPQVQSAVLIALGERRCEPARDEILLRARTASGEVRYAALRACGLLGGEGALSALIAGLADESDPQVPVAASRGLAALRDPGAAPILVSLLSRGPEDPCFEHARAGLLALGPSGVDELLRVVRASAHKARREAALILSEQLVPQAASVLMTLLSDTPDDARVAEELAVLTCVDLRLEVNPAAAWWAWWEYVVHDDAQAWLCAAAERLRLRAPTPQELREGTPAGLEFLFDVCRSDPSHLAERARRELTRLAGRELGRLPPRGAERERWIEGLRANLSNAQER